MVETVIADVSGVLDVAVFSEPSPLTGQAVGVFVFATLPQRQMRAPIRTACLARLEPWQVPPRIHFTDSPMATDRFKRDRHLPRPK